MQLADLARLTSLMIRISRGPRDGGVYRGVTEQRDLETRDTRTSYDLYLPQGRPRGSVVALHGMTRRGRHDPRLMHFARCLAQSGVACAVPSLAGLAECCWLTSDLDRLEELTLELAKSATPAGLIGFSLGGSYALIVAARQQVAPKVRFVLSFGAYHDMDQMFDWFVETQQREPSTEAQWDDRIYLNLIWADQHREQLQLSASLIAEIRALLSDYCRAPSPQEKRRFYERHLRQLNLAEVASSSRDPETVRTLSPHGQLHGLRCQVGLVHDEHDSIVPPGQARRLYAELGALPAGAHSRLLITSLISHVQLADMLKLREVGRFLSVLAPMIEVS
jgi:pimeloyl-ACP methyl ester carboxylesterase